MEWEGINVHNCYDYSKCPSILKTVGFNIRFLLNQEKKDVVVAQNIVTQYRCE